MDLFLWQQCALGDDLLDADLEGAGLVVGAVAARNQLPKRARVRKVPLNVVPRVRPGKELKISNQSPEQPPPRKYSTLMTSNRTNFGVTLVESHITSKATEKRGSGTFSRSPC